MPTPIRQELERLYGEGRDLAGWCACDLAGYEVISSFPTIESFINNIENGWPKDIDRLSKDMESRKKLVQKSGIKLWSINQMFILQEKQIEMLKAVVRTVERIKQHPEYIAIGIYRPVLSAHEVATIHYNIGAVHGPVITTVGNDNHRHVSSPPEPKEIPVAPTETTRDGKKRLHGIIDKVIAGLIVASLLWILQFGYVTFKDNPASGIDAAGKAVTILILLAGLIWLGYGAYNFIQGRSKLTKAIGWAFIIVLITLIIYQSVKIIAMPVGAPT